MKWVFWRNLPAFSLSKVYDESFYTQYILPLNWLGIEYLSLYIPVFGRYIFDFLPTSWPSIIDELIVLNWTDELGLSNDFFPVLSVTWVFCWFNLADIYSILSLCLTVSNLTLLAVLPLDWSLIIGLWVYDPGTSPNCLNFMFNSTPWTSRSSEETCECEF